jgi:hypothetical protein
VRVGQRIIGGLAATAIAATALIGLAPAAQSADNGDWSAAPERPEKTGTQFTPRQYFFFDLAPGGSIDDVVTIRNAKPTPKRLALYPADASNVTAGGGFAVTPPSDKPTEVGTWIKLAKTEVVVPAATTKTDKKTNRKTLVPGTVDVKFTLTVPKGATPGDHAGGIVTLEDKPGQTTTSASGAAIGIQRSLAVRVYTRVSGPLNPQLLMSDVKFTHFKPATMPFLGSQGSAVLEYTYTNTGNVRMTPKTEITYKGLLGRNVHASKSTASPEILPGETITITEAIVGTPVLDRVTARVAMKGDLSGDPLLAEVGTAGDTVKWSISWVFVAVLVVAAIALAIWLRRRNRRDAVAQPRGKRARTSVSETAPL